MRFLVIYRYEAVVVFEQTYLYIYTYMYTHFNLSGRGLRRDEEIRLYMTTSLASMYFSVHVFFVSIYLYICLYTYLYIYTDVSVYIHRRKIDVCHQVNMRTCSYMYIHIRIHVSLRTRILFRIHIPRMYIFIHICMYTQTRRITCPCPLW